MQKVCEEPKLQDIEGELQELSKQKEEEKEQRWSKADWSLLKLTGQDHARTAAKTVRQRAVEDREEAGEGREQD